VKSKGDSHDDNDENRCTVLIRPHMAIWSRGEKKQQETNLKYRKAIK
jgi:hypothetical protein